MSGMARRPWQLQPDTTMAFAKAARGGLEGR